MFAGILLAAMEVVAVYYPHWHEYPKGNEWFGADRWKQGEWCFVKDAIRRFPGHHQPMVPVAGYLNGSDPKDMEKEIALASNAGIDVFLYDYYYYGGQITMEECLEQGFLKAANRSKMKFALMWCYHTRKNAFRSPIGAEKPVLMDLAYTADEFLGLIDHSIARYFNRPEYWRKDGKLFFSIYDAKKFVEKVGAGQVKAALAQAREKVRVAGLGEIHFNAQNPKDIEMIGLFHTCGFDSVTDYNFNMHSVPGTGKMRARGEWELDYRATIPFVKRRWETMAKGPLLYIPTVTTGWDSTPRCSFDEPYPWKKIDYPYTMSLTNNNADAVRELLVAAREFAEKDPKNPGIVYVNGWNEYTEGTFLIPDNFEGDAKLRALASVFGRKPSNEYVFVDPAKKTLHAILAPTYANVTYARDDAKQKIDVWLPAGRSERTPLVVYFHGGGWTGGAIVDRIIGSSVRKLVDSGIAVAAVGYRYLRDAPRNGRCPVWTPLDDCEKALDFILAHAGEWHVDMKKVALSGGSAGAATSLCLALAEGNRRGIAAVMAIIPQTSLDPQEMKAWIPNSCYGAHAFGYRNFSDWLAHREEALPDIEKISAAALVRRIDPVKAPKLLIQSAYHPREGVLPKDPTHAGEFGVQFKRICDSRGVSCEIAYGGGNNFGAAFDRLIDFFR